MSENNFTALYKSLPTDKLLDIVDKSHDYQPLAVETARLELNSRRLTAEELETAKAIQAGRQNEQAGKRQKVKAVEEKFKSVGSSIIETFSPQKEALNTDKYIKLISLFLGGLFLYELYKEFGMLKYMFNGEDKWDFSVVLFLLPLILLPTASLLFWFRKRLGWTIATLFFSYTAAGAVVFFIHELNRKQTGIAVLDTIFPTTSPIIYVPSFLLFGGITWLLSKGNIREVYNIGRERMYITIGIGIGIVLLLRLSI